MKRTIITALSLALAVSAAAQTAAPAAQAQGDKIVATINGEVITKSKLDFLYDRLGAQMRMQYESTGGKAAFLENYLRKRLVIQEALKSGFDQRANVKAELDAAKEAALFDLYVRDVLSHEVVTEDLLRKFYDENKQQFATRERAKVRHIVIAMSGSNPKPKEEALRIIQGIEAELRPTAPLPNAAANVVEGFKNRFARAARQYSEDAVAQEGGDLGWVNREGLDAAFSDVAFSTPVGTMSRVVESSFGYHLIFVDALEPAGVQPFDKVRSTVRELVMRQKAADVMNNVNRLTNELRLNSKVSISRENID